MVFLGDKFPKDLKRKTIESNLVSGSVVKVESVFDHTTKDKFIVIGATEDGYILGFFINSVVNGFIAKNERLHKCQVKIDVDNHPFLDYDSYIACHEIKELHREDIINEIGEDLSKIKGNISCEVKDQVLAAIKFAPTISENQKNLLINSLK